MSNILKYTLRHYIGTHTDLHTRYRSWEHCYGHFRQRKKFKSTDDFDIAALHLAFYLASWGMYRGSAQILQKDYKIHIPVVKALVLKKYEPLWDLPIASLPDESPEIELLLDLTRDIKQALATNKIAPSPTLISKIIMGTMGCMPAYDRNFKSGVKGLKGFPASLGKKSLLAAVKFYTGNVDDFKEAERILEKSNHGIYPPMKLLDMYFYSLGEERERKKKIQADRAKKK